MTPTLKPSEVLSRAADLIEPEGAWCQRAFARTATAQPITYTDYPHCRGEVVSRCINGAICEASPDLATASKAQRYTARAVDVSAWLPGWNDTPGRTQTEVVSALRKAADLARSAGE